MPRFLRAVAALGWAGLLGGFALGCSDAKAPQVPEASLEEEAPAVDRQATLDGARDYAIELLEKGQYAALVINVIDVSMLERMAATSPGDNLIEGAIDDFAKSTEPRLLLAKLRESTRRTPALSGNIARFVVDVPKEHGTVAFERINGRWYLK